MNSALPRRRVVAGAVAMAIGLAVVITGPGADSSLAAPMNKTATPIKHLVVIFQENVSFDHYFGTYPNATNSSGQHFTGAPSTPAVNGLSGALLAANPNGVNPRRYDPTNRNDGITCDQDHNYSDEQKAFNSGAMDKFVATLGTGTGTSPAGSPCVAGDVMNYYDGNTVTGLWNYAQHFAMSDSSFSTTFGPSSPGAINLVSGDTGGVDMTHTVNNPSMATAAKPNADLTPDGQGGFSLTSDAQPFWDDCSTRDAVAMSGQNIGDKLNTAGLSWGFFEGGYRPTTFYPDALADTGHSGQSTATFIPDEFKNAGFQNAVPHSSNQGDFDQLVAGINHGDLPPAALPSVSFLKAPGYQDGHAAYSNPLNEQQFIAREINALMTPPDWRNTAVVVSYDDSDGWYDHDYSGVTNPSQTVADALTGTEQCGTAPMAPLAGQQGRCGYGPRMPLLVISPWAKANNVDHTLTDQSSITRFVEDNWGLGRITDSFDGTAGSLNGLFDFTNPHGQPPNGRPLLLDPTTGQVQAATTNTSLHVAPNPGFQGIPEILIANVSPFNAAGTVQFKDGTHDLGAPVPVGAGLAISTTSALATGTHTLTAVFTPINPTVFGPSTSPPATLTVNKLF